MTGSLSNLNWADSLLGAILGVLLAALFPPLFKRIFYKRK